MVEPLTHDEHIALWKHFDRNARRPNETVDCRLVELGMFISCDSSLNSESDISGGSDNDSSFPSIFPRSGKIMATSNPDPKDVREVGSVYIIEDHIDSLRYQLAFSSTNDEEEYVLDECSLEEKVNMVAFDANSTSSFYFYLPTIHEVEVHLPSSSFTKKVLD